MLLTEQLPDSDSLARHWLTAAELARADAIAGAGDRRDFLAAHLLVRWVAARLAGASPGGLIVGQRCDRCGGPHGRPVIEGALGLHVSLAHTQGAVIAVASDQPVGADIESLRRPRLSTETLAGVLSESEQQTIRRSADPHAAFLRQWTRKEALVKLGAGTLTRMADLDLGQLPISGEHDRLAVRTELAPLWPGLRLLDRVDHSSGIVFAVMSRRPVTLCAVPPGALCRPARMPPARAPGGPTAAARALDLLR